jgi:imidazoleglycerol-phosphate dehydratase
MAASSRGGNGSRSGFRLYARAAIPSFERMDAGDQASALAARVSLGTTGRVSVSTGLAVLDRLLELLADHAQIQLTLEVAPGGADAVTAAAGRSLGEALRDYVRAEGAPGYGSALVPAYEALASVALEASARPLLVSNVDLSDAHVAGLERDLVTAFLQELTEAAGLTLHVRLLHGEDAGHVLESIFKALGGALAAAGAPRKE